MSEVLVYALYVWVIVSLAVLAVRGVRHLLQQRSNDSSQLESGALPPITVEGPPASDPSSITVDVTDMDVPDVDVTDEALRSAERAATPSHSLTGNRLFAAPAPTITSEPTVTSEPTGAGSAQPQAPGRLSAPLFRSPTTSDIPRPTVVSTASLADAIRGVRLPFDLAPTNDAVEPARDDRIALATTTVTPAEVGTAMADELETLGFEVTVLSDDRAQATKGDATVGLHIIPDAHDVVNDDARRFPELTEPAVVLRLWLVD